MHKLILLVVFLLWLFDSQSQDFSNKGKEFWIGYGNHVRMFENITPQNAAEKMQLYITSDVSTTGTITIPGLSYVVSYSVTANQITTIDIPRTAALLDEGIYNLGIHVTALKPVIVYSFIYVNAISGATLCLPVNTLGREYYSINYTQVSNQPNSYSYFDVIATDTGITTVEIIPSQNTKGGHLAGVPYQVKLTRGQVYQVLGVATSTNNPYTGADLTGSQIRSISTGTAGCKKIAVFCGSGKMSIGCAGSGTSDNLYQQMYPVSTWGKTYITVPGINASRPSNQNNFFRIFRADVNTVVKINGTVIPTAGFVNGRYYEFSSLEAKYIESDKPVLIAQYLTTAGCAGNTGQGDPEMIYLNPVEQTISQVTLNSMQPAVSTNINEHHINVVLRNLPSVIGSFKIDGVARGQFTPLPANTAYAYAQFTVTQGPHTLTCDSGFNAIAYGFGNAESYGYSAGTNLKDLYQFVAIHNQYGTVNFPAGCKGSPFKFSMTFPYQPVKIKWLFKGIFNDTTITSPVYDSTWTVNGRTLYRYKLNRFYTINNIGTYPITLVADNPTTDGCSGEQEIDYDLQIFNRPGSGFTTTQTGCLKDPVNFIDTSSGNGRSVISWSWDFGDGTFSGLQSPAHNFAAAGSYNIKFATITDIGCLSDTASRLISITSPPIAAFSITSPACEKNAVIFNDSSRVSNGSITKWIWDFGDGTTLTTTDKKPVTHVYPAAGVFTVGLQVESNTGCKSSLTQQRLDVRPRPVISFNLPKVCLPGGDAQFTDLSVISDNSQSLFRYAWDFGDGTTSADKDPLHRYTRGGPFNVKLQVLSNYGCKADTTRVLSSVFLQPVAQFSTSPETCLGGTISFADKSSGSGSTVTKWQWDFGDKTVSTAQHPTHTYDSAGVYNVKLSVVTNEGCKSDTFVSSAIVNALPLAEFTVPPSICEKLPVAFNDASSANSGKVIKWNWNFDDGTVSSVQNPSHTFPGLKIYNVKLEVETDKGCKSRVKTKAIAVSPVPMPAFSTPEICLSDAFAQFFDSTRIADNSQNQFTYMWTFGDPASGALNNSTTRNAVHRYTSAGNYKIDLVVSSKDGCTATLTKDFTVNGSVPKAGFEVKNPTQLCSNTDVVISDGSSVDFGTVTRVEIFWDYRNDPTAKTTDEDPRSGKLYTRRYAPSPAAKDVEIRYVAYSGINCVDQVAKTITLQASPEIRFEPLTEVCEEVVPFTITSAREINGLPGSGIFSGKGVSSGGLFNARTATPGVHTIRYTFTAANGCSTFKEQSITVHPTPIINAGPDRTVLQGGSITIAAKGSANASYLWMPDVAIEDNKVLMPKVSPLEDITYQLQITSIHGCKATDNVTVKVLKDVKVPNAFSPNGDGINDTWKIEFLESYPGAKVEVFNRYGQLVFSSVNYTREWNGMYKGNVLPLGTYYYIIDPKNGRTKLNGAVSIIR